MLVAVHLLLLDVGPCSDNKTSGLLGCGSVFWILWIRAKDRSTTPVHFVLQESFKTSCINKKLLGAPGIATRSKDATRGSLSPYY